jgi:hypothetical protein
VQGTGDGPFLVANHAQRRLAVVHDSDIAPLGAMDGVAGLTNHAVFVLRLNTALRKQRFRNLQLIRVHRMTVGSFEIGFIHMTCLTQTGIDIRQLKKRKGSGYGFFRRCPGCGRPPAVG